MNRLKPVIGGAALVLGLGAAPLALAGGYFGAGVGTANYDNTNRGVSLDEDSNPWKIFGGYRITDHWGFEAGWVDLGKFDDADSSVEIEGFALAGTGTWSLNDSFELFGKLGLYFAEGTVKFADGFVDRDDGGTDALIGVGANYYISDAFSVRLEYERYEGDSDVDAIGVAAMLNF